MHIAVQFLVLVPASTEAALQVALGWHWPTWTDGLACIAAGVTYYALYEYGLEPPSKWLVRRGKPSLVGPYVERGPQDGEVYLYP